MKKFIRAQAYKRYFKKGWKVCYRQRVKLRRVLQTIFEKVNLHERMKYQREFETKQEAINQWKGRLEEHRQLVKQYTALTHYRQNLLVKSLSTWKRVFHVTKGFSRLEQLTKRVSYNPPFQTIKRVTRMQLKTEQDFINYRETYLMHKIFSQLKENRLEG